MRAGVSLSVGAGISHGLRRSAASGRASRSWVNTARISQVQRSAASGVRIFGQVQPRVCLKSLNVCSMSKRRRNNACQSRSSPCLTRRADALRVRCIPGGRVAEDELATERYGRRANAYRMRRASRSVRCLPCRSERTASPCSRRSTDLMRRTHCGASATRTCGPTPASVARYAHPRTLPGPEGVRDGAECYGTVRHVPTLPGCTTRP